MDQTHFGYRSWDEPRGGNVKPVVTRLQPGESTAGKSVFTEDHGVVVMEAEHYFEAKPFAGAHWAVILYCSHRRGLELVPDEADRPRR